MLESISGAETAQVNVVVKGAVRRAWFSAWSQGYWEVLLSLRAPSPDQRVSYITF